MESLQRSHPHLGVFNDTSLRAKILLNQISTTKDTYDCLSVDDQMGRFTIHISHPSIFVFNSNFSHKILIFYFQQRSKMKLIKNQQLGMKHKVCLTPNHPRVQKEAQKRRSTLSFQISTHLGNVTQIAIHNCSSSTTFG